MKKILIRSGISPLDVFEADYMIDKNSIGGNVGNLIYAYSVYRALTTEGTTIIPDYYKIDHNEADYINENYDCYVIPLADAFREPFMPALRRYTKLIKKLNIPVIVIGVGLSAPFEPKLNEGFPFDQDVKDFVTAVLEKSSMIGVRGQITADYLTRLGFKEDVDHKVIGCPSMYSFGSELKIRDTVITKDSRVAVNNSLKSPENVLDFIDRSTKEYTNYHFIPQWRIEMMLAYSGMGEVTKRDVNYMSKMTHEAYMNDKVRFFLNAPTWIDFMKEVDLSYGARLHGNITATIAGTPSLIIPKDARMRELAEYHQLTSLWWKDIDENTRLEDVIEKADFKSPEKPQAENFANFIDFLEKNDLDHVYKDNHALKHVHLDDLMKDVEHLPAIKPISAIEIDELVDRLGKYNHIVEGQQKRTENRLRKEITNKNKRIKYLEGTLNRKAARLALGFADKFSFKK